MSPEPARILSDRDHLDAELYRPDGAGPHPAVLMAPGFGGTKVLRLPAFAERFRSAGFLTVLFDYRHFGASEGEPRQLLSIRRQLEDWHAALGFTRALPTVDPKRVALWGTSFSGGHVVRVAAKDGAVPAVVSQIPFASGFATALALPPLSSLKMLVAGAADWIRSGLGGRPVTVPLVGPPGTMAAMALDSAVEGFARLRDRSDEPDRVCARIGPSTLFYRPLGQAGKVRCPLLVQVAEWDDLTPARPARRMAARAPRGELRSYPAGHFDVYFDASFEALVADQLAFLSRHLRSESPDGSRGISSTTESPTPG